MNINAYNSGFISSLFSFGNSGTSGGMARLYSSLSEYRSISSGNYGKLLKKYFSEYGTPSVKSSDSSSKAAASYDVLDEIRKKYQTSKTDTDEKTDGTDKASSSDTAKKTSLSRYEQDAMKNAETMVTASGDLKSSLNTLMNKKTYGADDTDEAASDSAAQPKTQSTEEISEAVGKAAETFVKSYNAAIDASGKSTNSGVSANTRHLMDLTKRYSSSLKGIGISVSEDGKLSLDSTALKNAGTDAVKDVFTKGGSYGTGAATWASMISYYASSAVSNGTYTSSGSYLASSASSYNGYI